MSAEMLMLGAQAAKAMRLARPAARASRLASVSTRSHLLRQTTMAQPFSAAVAASFWSCSVTPTEASITSRQTSARSIAARPRTRL